jgi:hypothetical protein
MIWINEQRGEHAAQRPGDMPADNVVTAAQLDQLTGDLSRYGADLIVAARSAMRCKAATVSASSLIGMPHEMR